MHKYYLYYFLKKIYYSYTAKKTQIQVYNKDYRTSYKNNWIKNIKDYNP